MNAMKEQGKAMSGQLEQMKADSDQMREASHLDSRAWVGISAASHQPVTIGRKIEFEFRFTNTGKTPALNVTAFHAVCHAAFGANIETFAAECERTGWQNIVSQRPIAPNAVAPISFDSMKLEVSEPLLEEIKSGKVIVYALGKLIYDDIFGRKHKTWYCFIIDPSKAHLVDHMHAYKEYNGMD